MKYLFLIILYCITKFSFAITASDFVRQLIDIHPLFKQQKINHKLYLAQNKSNLGYADWVLSLNADHLNKSGNNILTSSIKNYSKNKIDTSISRKIYATGGTFSLEHSIFKTDQETKISSSGKFYFGYGDYYSNSFIAIYKQPLLKNFGGIIDRSLYDLSSYDIRLDEIQSMEYQEAFLLDKLILFLDWALFSEQEKINITRLNLATKELDLAQKKYKKSYIERVDLLLYQDAFNTAQENLLDTQSSLVDIANRVAVVLGDNDLLVDRPQLDIYKIVTLPDFNLKKIMEERNNSLGLIKINKKKLQREIETYVNEKKAILDLTLSASVIGEDQNSSNAIQKMSPQYGVGLEFSYPLGNTKVKNNLRAAQLRLKQLHNNYSNQLISLLAVAKGLTAKILSTQRLIKLDYKHKELANLRVKEEKKRYLNGHGNLTFVLQTQEKEQNLALKRALHAVQQYKNILRFFKIVNLPLQKIIEKDFSFAAED